MRVSTGAKKGRTLPKDKAVFPPHTEDSAHKLFHKGTEESQGWSSCAPGHTAVSPSGIPGMGPQLSHPTPLATGRSSPALCSATTTAGLCEVEQGAAAWELGSSKEGEDAGVEVI